MTVFLMFSLIIAICFLVLNIKSFKQIGIILLLLCILIHLNVYVY